MPDEQTAMCTVPRSISVGGMRVGDAYALQLGDEQSLATHFPEAALFSALVGC